MADPALMMPDPPSPTPRTSLGASIRPAGVALLALSLLAGVFYPTLVFVLARLAWPRQAEGSLVLRAGRAIGSRWIGQATAYQVHRVATHRGLNEAQVRHLVEACTEGPQLGVFGEPRVNVLRLNLALDDLGTR